MGQMAGLLGTAGGMGIGFALGGPFGMAIGGMASGILTGLLFPASAKTPKLEPAKMTLPSSQYGSAIPAIYGTRMVAGNVIWYGNFKSKKNKQSGAGGKGGAMGGGGGEYYTYSASCAIALSITPVRLINILKGKSAYDKSKVTFYDGSQIAPDPHIKEVMQAQGNTRFPVWKRLSYVVFKDVDLGTQTSFPVFTFKIRHITGISDSETPSNIVKNILTDDFYGAGLSENNIDYGSFCAVTSLSLQSDLMLDAAFDNQVNLIDALDNIAKHHNGMIVYQDGKIRYTQLHDKMQSQFTFAEDDFVKNHDGSSVSVSYAGGRESYNKVSIEYTKSNKKYVPGTIQCKDLVDIARNGLRDISLNLNYLTTASRAGIVGQILLNKYVSNAKIIKAKVGIGSRSRAKVGTQVTISDSTVGLPPTLFTILQVTEGADFTLDIVAIEEILSNYTTGTALDDVSSEEEPPDFGANASPVLRPLAFELPAVYNNSTDGRYGVSFAQPDEIQWGSSILYGSYTSGTGYISLDNTVMAGNTGEVSEIGEGDGGTKYIKVDFDGEVMLESALDFDTLIKTPMMNMMVFKTSQGDKFARFATAELITANTWKISDIIYDTVYLPMKNTCGNISVGNSCFVYGTIPYVEKLVDMDVGKTLYYKVSSANIKGNESDLSEASEINLPVKGLHNKPLTPFGMKVNGISIDDSMSIIVSDADIDFAWASANRFDWTTESRTDAPHEDLDFQYFEILVFNGGTWRRSLNQTAKTYKYTWANKSSDGTTSPFKFIVRQVNSKGVSDDYIVNVTFV